MASIYGQFAKHFSSAEEMEAYILTDKATFLTFVANDGIMG